MTVPPWMSPEQPPRPARGEPWFPFIVDQQPQDDGTVLVTVSLPGLARAVVRVPQSAWINGEHLRTFDHLASLTRPPTIPHDDDPQLTDTGNDENDY